MILLALSKTRPGLDPGPLPVHEAPDQVRGAAGIGGHPNNAFDEAKA